MQRPKVTMDCLALDTAIAVLRVQNGRTAEEDGAAAAAIAQLEALKAQLLAQQEEQQQLSTSCNVGLTFEVPPVPPAVARVDSFGGDIFDDASPSGRNIENAPSLPGTFRQTSGLRLLDPVLARQVSGRGVAPAAKSPRTIRNGFVPRLSRLEAGPPAITVDHPVSASENNTPTAPRAASPLTRLASAAAIVAPPTGAGDAELGTEVEEEVDEDVAKWLNHNFADAHHRENVGFDVKLRKASKTDGSPRSSSSVGRSSFLDSDAPPEATDSSVTSASAENNASPTVVPHAPAKAYVYSRSHKRSFPTFCTTRRYRELLEASGAVELPKINDVDFNIFSHFERLGADVFFHVCVNILFQYNFIQSLDLNVGCLLAFLRAVQQCYRRENPYHNACHAADVLQTTHVYLCTNDVKEYFSDVELLAVLFAALIHDVGHIGTSNAFLQRTNHPVAMLYNDVSVQENMHTSFAFFLLIDPQFNFFQSSHAWNEVYFKDFRRLVVDIVWGTDMRNHAALTESVMSILADGVIEDDEVGRLFRAIVHAADLSNPMKDTPVYLEWAERVMAELWQQGDEEIRRGLPVSAMCERSADSFAKSQRGFIEFVVKPFMRELAPVLPEVWMQRMDRNLEIVANMTAAEQERCVARIQELAAPQWQPGNEFGFLHFILDSANAKRPAPPTDSAPGAATDSKTLSATSGAEFGGFVAFDDVRSQGDDDGDVSGRAGGGQSLMATYTSGVDFAALAVRRVSGGPEDLIKHTRAADEQQRLMHASHLHALSQHCRNAAEQLRRGAVEAVKAAHHFIKLVLELEGEQAVLQPSTTISGAGGSLRNGIRPVLYLRNCVRREAASCVSPTARNLGSLSAPIQRHGQLAPMDSTASRDDEAPRGSDLLRLVERHPEVALAIVRAAGGHGKTLDSHDPLAVSTGSSRPSSAGVVENIVTFPTVEAVEGLMTESVASLCALLDVAIAAVMGAPSQSEPRGRATSVLGPNTTVTAPLVPPQVQLQPLASSSAATTPAPGPLTTNASAPAAFVGSASVGTPRQLLSNSGLFGAVRRAGTGTSPGSTIHRPVTPANGYAARTHALDTRAMAERWETFLPCVKPPTTTTPTRGVLPALHP